MINLRLLVFAGLVVLHANVFAQDTNFWIFHCYQHLRPTPTESALIIGTDRAIWALDADGNMAKLTDYGVVPGWPWAFDEPVDEDAQRAVLIWTLRGLCRAMPFKNLTGGHHLAAPGVQAGAAVMAYNGQKRFVAVLHQGGTAFNQRT